MYTTLCFYSENLEFSCERARGREGQISLYRVRKGEESRSYDLDRSPTL